MGKLARCLGPTQSTGDEVEGLPTAVEAVKDALAGGVEFINPVDCGTVPGNVGGEAPVPCAVAGAEHEAGSGLGPPQEVQEPLGERLAGPILPPVSGGVVWGRASRG